MSGTMRADPANAPAMITRSTTARTSTMKDTEHTAKNGKIEVEDLVLMVIEETEDIVRTNTATPTTSCMAVKMVDSTIIPMELITKAEFTTRL